MSYKKKKRLFSDIIRAISLVLDFDAGKNLGHGFRVAVLAKRLAAALDLPHYGLLYVAGLLHDLGAIGLDKHIVYAALDNFKEDIYRQHTLEGVKLLAPIPILKAIVPIIADHHERFDGLGFPRGKKAGAISKEAAILALADHIDVEFFALKRRQLPTLEPALWIEEIQGELLTAIERFSDKVCEKYMVEAALNLFTKEPEFLLLLADENRLEQYVYETGYVPPVLENIEETDLICQLLWLFARIIDKKHTYTADHSFKTTYYAYKIAAALGDNQLNLLEVIYAGLLHDVGKVGIAKEILNKTTTLTSEEWSLIKKHTHDTAEIISQIRDLAHLAYPAAAHHERYDGLGYPFNRAGDGIPLLGRVLAYADAYNSLLEDRAYRKGMGKEAALALLKKRVGTHLDPHIAEVALETLKNCREESLTLPENLTDFKRIFNLEQANELLTSTKKSQALEETAEYALKKAKFKGVLLLDLENWRTLKLSDDFVIISGHEYLTDISEQIRSPSFLDYLIASDAQFLKDIGQTLEIGKIFTRYLFSLQGKPLEVIIIKQINYYDLYFRYAENRFQSLKRMSMFYRNFLHSTEAAFFVDILGRIIDVNRAFLDLYGYQLREVIGKQASLIFGKQEYPARLQEIFKPQSGTGKSTNLGEVLSFEVNTYTKDTKEIWSIFNLITVADNAGKLLGYIGRVLDITENKCLTTALKDKNKRLEEMNKLLKDLMVITSHDLKAPINAMISYAKLLQDKLVHLKPEEILGYVTKLIAAGEKSLYFIDDLLDLEKIESGTFEIHKILSSLNKVLQSSIEAQKIVGAAKNIQLVYHEEGQPQKILIDSLRMEQVFNNIITNALKFSPPNSQITIKYLDDVDKVTISIADQGPGILESEQRAIFERYYQVKISNESITKSSRLHGVGLGLYIAKDIVAMHQGTIRVQNLETGGCVFIIELPK